ncbi:MULTISPECIES: PspC domain-containing protein [unclassified Oceanispirochaeta]|uniref:PspC domain-containing protein n=1 Tax=unclassified Oceanispirochaeta TaxID=2635722 RepID=UPI000E091BAC|nr:MULTISPECIES: PspC domain-containing protein [unclassified Oceanispirochaeta]MBF9015308.1 PspC domain-containing protein [Oceanispirochaeta sp. M2]NPD71766.1 PspC domain-containing protein [Oceanispirochaeta sp. M1]RDG32957.1 PspC domain-containing protein [Oceanispirochaeta sp. M1]
MKIYRSHDGLFLGVCKGLEESLGIPARYSRLIFIILAIIFKAWIILAIYLLAAILMPIRSGEDWKIQDNFETLSRDARRWSRKEYDDIREMLRRSESSSAESDIKDPDEKETEPEAEPKTPPRASPKKAKTTAKTTAKSSSKTTSKSTKKVDKDESGEA